MSLRALMLSYCQWALDNQYKMLKKGVHLIYEFSVGWVSFELQFYKVR